MKKIVLLLLVIITTKSFSFEFTVDYKQGFYWREFPIKMKRFSINPSEAAQLETFVREAEDEWEQAVGQEIWDFNSGEESNNIIRWSNNFAYETGYDPMNTLAVTIRFHDGTYIDRTEIILNGGIMYLRDNVNGILKTTILHELGHTLGLDHSRLPAVMQAYLGNFIELQPDDIDGAVAIMGDTVEKQVDNYISEYSTLNKDDGDNQVVSCATINIDSNIPPNRLVNIILSMLLGIFIVPIIRLSNNISLVNN